jgi:hypothetical protein
MSLVDVPLVPFLPVRQSGRDDAANITPNGKYDMEHDAVGLSSRSHTGFVVVPPAVPPLDRVALENYAAKPKPNPRSR